MSVYQWATPNTTPNTTSLKTTILECDQPQFNNNYGHHTHIQVSHPEQDCEHSHHKDDATKTTQEVPDPNTPIGECSEEGGE